MYLYVKRFVRIVLHFSKNIPKGLMAKDYMGGIKFGFFMRLTFYTFLLREKCELRIPYI